jgi:hypothetical protein
VIYAIYDSATGDVLRTVTCPEDLIELQCGPGESYVASGEFVDDTLHRIEAGVVVAKERTLDELKADVRFAVRARRNAAEWGGCNTPSGRIDSDPDSQRKINGSVTMALIAGSAFSVDWRLSDNTVTTLNASQMINVGLAVGQHVSACQDRKNDLDAAITAATSATELAAIDIETGWPS